MLIEDRSRNKVERAICEIRRGLPILMYDESNYLLFTAAEILDRRSFDQYKLMSGNLRIALTSRKLQHTFQSGENRMKRLPIHDFNELLCLVKCLGGKPELLQPSKEEIDKCAIDLLKVSELLPYALVVDMMFECRSKMRDWCELNDVVSLEKSFIRNFQQSNVLYEVCRTSLFLKQTQEVSVISYRSKSSGRDYYAIIVGTPDNDEPLVRIHSSCYTGDLLDSLSCDCGSQLRRAIQVMVDSNGGIVLYLMQDGRGIGLTNKLRAYDMQKKYNLDTVDANRMLGFEDDERDFSVAAEILKKLGIKKVQLLTNNGRKLSGLNSSGIEVTRCLPLITKCNKYNTSYMETKFGRLGHKLIIF